MQDDKKNTDDIEEKISSITKTISDLPRQLDQYVKEIIPVYKKQAEVYESSAQLFDNVSYLLFGTIQASQKPSEPISTDSDNTGYILNSSKYTKDEVIAAMRSMRKEGATYSEIVDWLKYKGMLTFSGRGEWHTQTVHRLCK